MQHDSGSGQFCSPWFDVHRTLSERSARADKLWSDGKYAEAEKEHRAILAMRLRLLGKDDTDIIESRSSLAAALSENGKYAEAVKENRTVLAECVRVLGPEHDGTLTTRLNLASDLLNQNKHTEAENEFRAVLAIYERQHRPEHSEALRCRNGMADVLHGQHRYAEAEKEHRAVLAIRERVLGRQHLDVFQTCYNLALCLGDQKKLWEALEFAQRAENGRNKILGAEHPDSKFAKKAREHIEAKLQKYLTFLNAKVADEHCTIEQALRQSLTAVLCAPDFLLLQESPGPLDDHALAARLSYFLWRSMPDQPLLELAGQQKLRAPGELRRQVERMLLDQRASAFAENFLGQWLGLRQIDATTPDRVLYPEFDDYLRYSMLREPQRFFEEMLRRDLGIQNLIASDFSMLNDRLAEHYGIPGVEGPELRPVKLPPESHRGGVLTMAAVLKVTANGTVTSPVLRGAWLLDKIMGQPLQLPANLMVAAVEPDIRGARDIREQLAKHRTVPQCASCHQKIDPFGFALENFDPIGGYRTNYRAMGKHPKAPVKVHDKPVEYSPGLPVQAGDVMPNGRPFSDCDAFKKLLLDDQALVVRTVTEKMLVYATGSPMRPADRPAVDTILRRVHEKNDGLRTLVHELIQSELFLNK